MSRISPPSVIDHLSSRSLSSRMQSAQLRDWHAVALLAAAVAFFFRDIITQRAFFWEDFITQAYPFRAFASVSLARGELPLWNPYTFSGMPFQADIQSAVFYLPNLLLVPFVRDGYLSFHLFEMFVVAHYWVAGGTMYYLAKEFGLEPVYALFGALLFSFSGFLVVQALHPAFVQQLAWFPLILLLFHRSIARRSVRFALWTGVTIGLSQLAGAPQVALFLSLLLGLYAVFQFLVGGGFRSPAALRANVHALLLPALSAAVALGVAAIQLLPTIELQPLSERASMTFEQAQHGRMEFRQFLTAIVPGFFGVINATQDSWWGAGEYGTFWETCFYMGIPGFFSLLFALFLLKTIPLARFLFGVGVLALLLALGDQFFLHRFFFNFVPGFGAFRGIGRATMLATFAGSLLGGMGLRWFVQTARRDARLAQMAMGTAAAAVGMLWVLVRFRILFPNEMQLADPGVFDDSMSRTTVALIYTLVFATLGIAMARRILKPAAALPALLVLQFADVHNFGRSHVNGDLNGMTYFTREGDPILKGVKEESSREFIRVAARTGNTLLLDRNHGMVERIFLVEGYTPLKLSRVEPPANTLTRSYDMLNAKLRAVVQEETGLRGLAIFGSYLPRAYIVQHAIVAPTDGSVIDEMRRDTFDPARTVVLERDPGLALDSAAPMPRPVSIGSYGINRISIDVEAERNGVLVLSEIWYPGWIATVDGKPAPLLRANWSLRAVPVPAGSRRVEVRFVPSSFYRGAIISLATLLLVAGVAGRRLMIE